MPAEPHDELPVSEARDHLSQVVNRAAYGDEITWITRGRGRQRAAAVVPAWLVDAWEELLDKEDVRIAEERLAEVHAGRSQLVPVDEVGEELGL